MPMKVVVLAAAMTVQDSGPQRISGGWASAFRQ